MINKTFRCNQADIKAYIRKIVNYAEQHIAVIDGNKEANAWKRR